MPFILLIAVLSWTIVLAAPLTENAIRSAQKITVVTGSFDPWTQENQEAVRRIIASGEADLVVVVPAERVAGDIPLPVKNRLQLIDASLNSSANITYPLGPLEGSYDEVVNRITAINPRVSRVTLPSSSAVNIRSWMTENVNQYFEGTRTPPAGLSPAIYDRIVNDGLYLGRNSEGRSIVGSTLSFVVNQTTKYGIYDKVRAIAVRVMARPNLREFQMGEQTVTIEKYLASGLTGDAYVTQIDGVPTVLKISKNSESARHSMREASLVHAWLTRTTSINLPELRAMGPNGEWQALELVRGDSLDKYISKHGGTIPPEIEERLRQLYSEAALLNERSAIKLDISADNIFIRESDGAAVLVDFGPIRPSNTFASSYDVARARWITAAAARVPPRPGVPSTVNDPCELRALANLLRSRP